MHSVSRPAAEPPELTTLRRSGGEDFGPLDAPLDEVFNGICAYCERKPLWRSRQDGAGALDTDLPDREGLLFTCDHLKPRRVLCNSHPSVGQCLSNAPPHAPDCTIYDWPNLVYACQSCNAVKGGQWPADADEADAYIDPGIQAGDLAAPHRVFQYDLDNGRVEVHVGTTGVARANAIRTIEDLALNDPRGRIETSNYSAEARRISLADLRQRWVRDLKRTLDFIVEVAPSTLADIVRESVAPDARFSSIARQFVAESMYRRYLP